MQGPERYLNELDIALDCAVDPENRATIDTAHRVLVNWEAYYVSDDAALAAFQAAPYEYTGLITDPVTQERFEPQAMSPRREHGGRLFFFSSDEAVAQFDTEPDKFAIPMIAMREVKN